MRYQKCDGIILHTQPIFERDLLVELFSGQFGKAKYLAKGVFSRRKQAGFSGCLQVTHHVRVQLYQAKIPIISQCDLVSSTAQIRNDIRRLQAAFYFLDIIRKATVQHQPNTDLFELLQTALTRLNQLEDCEQVISDFHYQFLKSEGLLDSHHTLINSEIFRDRFEQYTHHQVCLI